MCGIKKENRMINLLQENIKNESQRSNENKYLAK
jgi:hypothetical protein